MNRNEFLATEVMGMFRGFTSGDGWHWHKIATHPYCLLDEWNPGKSWPQTGLLLGAMEKDYRVNIYQFVNSDAGLSYCVIFVGLDSSGEAIDMDMREAIATAAARACGWKEMTDGNES